MARAFTGGSNTTMLNRTITNPAASAFSTGCWVKFNAYATGRTLVGAGSGTTAMHGLMTGAATAQRLGLRVDCATSDMILEIAAPATGAWYCAIAVWRNSLTSSLSDIYTGNLTTAMAVTAHASDTNGVGAFNSQTAGVIGKNATATTAVDATIAFPFITPFAMTVDECERFRQGDWSAIFRGGLPLAFVPMEMNTAATRDLAQAAAWTVTSTPTVVEDPPIRFGMGAPSGMHVRRKIPVLNLSTPSGAMTPSGGLTRGTTYARTLTGAFT